MMARRSKFSAEEAAKAANKICRFDCEADQAALVEVLNDYFCPQNREEEDDLMSDSEDCQPHTRGGVLYCNNNSS